MSAWAFSSPRSGRLVYERAKEMRVGTEVDADLFMQYDDDLRAIRDEAFLADK